MYLANREPNELSRWAGRKTNRARYCRPADASLSQSRRITSPVSALLRMKIAKQLSRALSVEHSLGLIWQDKCPIRCGYAKEFSSLPS
jgi:hypothetical protein